MNWCGNITMQRTANSGAHITSIEFRAWVFNHTHDKTECFIHVLIPETVCYQRSTWEKRELWSYTYYTLGLLTKLNVDVILGFVAVVGNTDTEALSCNRSAKQELSVWWNHQHPDWTSSHLLCCYLIHWGWGTHSCVRKLCHQWFRLWLDRH